MEKVRVDPESASVQMVRLRERHGELERRLAQLERHLSLTPDEQVERIQLKKEKLRTKDLLQRLGAVRAS
ncbi:MAG: YdcH family protein [Pseudomonadota bacterium]